MKLKTLTALLFSAVAMFSAPSVSAEVIPNNDQSLKILSWNIQMLPRLAKYVGQSERAELISRQLKDTDYDVIVFQEAFDKKARGLMWEKLKGTFPYQEGPVNLKGSPFKTNGGVWILCKYPLKKLGEIKYTVSSGFDAMARKGAMLLELVKNGKTYQIAGTHLQSDDGPKKEEQRIVQYNEMIMKLLLPFRNDTIPQIVCGDFNISKKDYLHYNKLVRSIEPIDNPECDKDVCQKVPVIGVEQYTWDYTKNDMIPAPCEITTYDYIFVRKNRLSFRDISRRVKEFTGTWRAGKKDKKALSDHFAMEIVLVPTPKI